MKKSYSLAAYTVTHFCIDLACGFTVISLASGAAESAGAILLYNFLAFGLQFLFGMYFDTRDYRMAAFAGVVLVFAGTLLTPAGLYPCAALLGLGNALFHVGGGIESLRRDKGHARSGVFVSSGALGVALGMYMGTHALDKGYLVNRLIAAGLVLCFVLLFYLGAQDREEDEKRPLRNKAACGGTFAIIGLCFLSVVVRSYVGFAAAMSWKTGLWGVVLAAGCSLGGKALGGFAADRFGGRLTGIVTLIVSIPLLIFGKDVMLLGACGLVLFNMTMPITLCATADTLPGSEGFTFGLTTLALLVGYLAYTAVGAAAPVWLAVMIVASALCIALGVPGREKA